MNAPYISSQSGIRYVRGDKSPGNTQQDEYETPPGTDFEFRSRFYPKLGGARTQRKHCCLRKDNISARTRRSLPVVDEKTSFENCPTGCFLEWCMYFCKPVLGTCYFTAVNHVAGMLLRRGILGSFEG